MKILPLFAASLIFISCTSTPSTAPSQAGQTPANAQGGNEIGNGINKTISGVNRVENTVRSAQAIQSLF